MGEPAEVFTHVIYENEETKRRTVVGTGAKPSKYEVASSQGDKGDTISKSHTDETALWRLKVLSIVLMIMVIISTVTFSALIYTLVNIFILLLAVKSVYISGENKSGINH